MATTKVFLCSILLLLTSTTVAFLTTRLQYNTPLPLQYRCRFDETHRSLRDTKLSATDVETDPSIESEQAEQQPAFIAPIINRGRMEISVESPYGDAVRSIQKAKEELLSILDNDVNSLDVHFRIEYLVRALEETFIPIQTIPFLVHTISGCWQKVYTNVMTPRASSALQCNIKQQILGDVTYTTGNVTELIEWQYEEGDNNTNDVSLIEGDLTVQSRYSINSKGELALDLQGHTLQVKSSKAPSDLEEFILEMQLTVPFESFDPHMTLMEITYVDPDIRICRVKGDKFYQVFNIFKKHAQHSTSTGSRGGYA